MATSKMKLWLDDIRDPKRFRPGEDWHWCKTNTEFIRTLNTINPDYIEGVAFDHDKSHLVWVDRKDFSVHYAPDLEDSDKRIFQELTCDETYEAGVTVLRMWADLHNKRNFPVEIITSNTAKIEPYKSILGDRFVITVNTGGCQPKEML